MPLFATATREADPADAGATGAAANMAQQFGASAGTAVLNTIAATATASYVASHHGLAGTAAAALSHGYRVASVWAAAALVLAALIGGALITTRPRAAPSDRRCSRASHQPGAYLPRGGGAGVEAELGEDAGHEPQPECPLSTSRPAMYSSPCTTGLRPQVRGASAPSQACPVPAAGTRACLLPGAGRTADLYRRRTARSITGEERTRLRLTPFTEIGYRRPVPEPAPLSRGGAAPTRGLSRSLSVPVRDLAMPQSERGPADRATFWSLLRHAA